MERSTAIASLVNKIVNVDVIIWDEASMSSLWIYCITVLPWMQTTWSHLPENKLSWLENSYSLGPSQTDLMKAHLCLTHMFFIALNWNELWDNPQMKLSLPLLWSKSVLEIVLQLHWTLTPAFPENFIQIKIKSSHLYSLERPRPSFKKKVVVDSIPGESVRLEAEFSGVTNNMIWPGEETVILKEGARVMLV